MLSKAGEIRRDEACLDYSGNDVVLYPCHGSKGNQVKLKKKSFHTISNKIINFVPFVIQSSGHMTQTLNKFGTVHLKNVWR